MKKLSLTFLSITVLLLLSCNNQESHHDSNHVSPDEEAIEVTKVSKPENEDAGAFVHAVIQGYLDIKGALANDNSEDAATASHEFTEALDNFDATTLTEDEAVAYNDFAQNARNISAQISNDNNDIENQRIAFFELSNSIEGFIKKFGTGGQTIYKDYCPMARDDEGAAWFSEVKNIENPYFGSSMFACGVIQEQYEE